MKNQEKQGDIEDDRIYANIPLNMPCIRCNRLKGLTKTCEAFPNGIPDKIWTGKHMHTSSVDGDLGILFKDILA